MNLTLDQAALVTGTSVRTVQNRVSDGHFKPIYSGRYTYIDAESIIGYYTTRSHTAREDLRRVRANIAHLRDAQ